MAGRSVRDPEVVAEPFEKPLGIVRRSIPQCRRKGDPAIERLGIVRGDNPAGEADVGEVLAVGVTVRVGQVRMTGQRKLLSGERRPGLVR